MIRPALLEIEGVRSFKERATITFPSNGAVLVSGKYADSLISSGSGKSTILMSIAYALGFSPIPATELKNWGSKQLYVKLVLQDDSKQYVIVRDPKLKVTDGSTSLEGTAAEEFLVKLLNAPIELAKVLTYRAQREPGVFVGATDSQKKEMLSTLLGLSEIEGASERVKTEMISVESKIMQAQTRIDTIASQLPMLQVDQQKMNTLHATYVDAYNRVMSLQNVNITTLQNQLVIIGQEITKCMSASRTSASAQSEIHSIDRNIEQMLTSLRSLQEGTCPTCKQSWSSSKTSVDQMENQVLSFRAKKAELESIVKNAAVLENSLPLLRTQEQETSAKIASQSAPMLDANSALQSAKAAFDQANQQVTTYNALQQQEAAAKEQLSVLQAQAVTLKHLDEILGRNGFLSVIFDEVLAEIERLTNDLMSEIPNVCEFTVGIGSTTTTKTGNTKKSISVVLHKDGKEVSIKTLSGGQRCALDLAVDLAISDAIRRRSGTRLGWVALDEAMDGLDIETKRAALDTIKKKIGGLLIVVDHSTEIKESFESVIEIEFDGRNSKVL